MSKHILVCLPISAEQRTRIETVQGFAYRFTTPDTATVEDALWADAVLGNLPVPLIRQNDHLEWFQSNAAGPNNYLEPGVLPEKCIVTNATGAYGLAISECMLAMWLSLLKELPTYRDNQREHRWAPTGHFVGSIAGSRVLCVGMGDIGSNFVCAGGRGGGRAPHRAPGYSLPGLLHPCGGAERIGRRAAAG